MADKDVNQGWGDLNGSLNEWLCPKCEHTYPVKDWAISWGVINSVKMDGRKCPQCEFTAYQHDETTEMIPKCAS